MVKRSKRIEKSLESLKQQIETHFLRLEKDIKEKKEFLARYHIKEIEKSLIDDLEYRMSILGKIDKNILGKYRERLKKLEESISNSKP